MHTHVRTHTLTYTHVRAPLHTHGRSGVDGIPAARRVQPLLLSASLHPGRSCGSVCLWVSLQSKNAPHSQGEYDVYSTFQSHEPEFDYLKSLEIEEKINKIKWLPQQNAAHSLLSTNGEAPRVWWPDLTWAPGFSVALGTTRPFSSAFPS